MTVTLINMPGIFPGILTDTDTIKDYSSAASSNEVLTEEPPVLQAFEYEIPTGRLSIGWHVATPSWISPLLDEIVELLWLEENWFSYGAHKIELGIVISVFNFIGTLVENNSPKPLVGPTVDGGVQLEWHNNGITLEIEFVSPSTIEILYVENDQYHEWSELIGKPSERLLEAIRRIAGN